MRLFVAAASLSAAFASPAMAQDALPFNGGHLEVIGGYDRPRADGESDTGFLYGVAGGFDFNTGRVVAGVELEAADSTEKLCEVNVCLKAGRDLYAGGRVGAVVGGQALVYLKAGYTNAAFKLEEDGDKIDSETLDGVRVGAGVEGNVGRFLAKIEYRYSNYESDLERHQALVGVGVRF